MNSSQRTSVFQSYFVIQDDINSENRLTKLVGKCVTCADTNTTRKLTTVSPLIKDVCVLHFSVCFIQGRDTQKA